MLDRLEFLEDILLQVVEYLQLDAIVLSYVCTRLWSLRTKRIFWMRALQSIKNSETFPLPLTPNTQLSDLEVNKLRDLALQARRLHHNLSLPEPHVSSLITTKPFVHKVLFVIPETDLVVLLSFTKKILCWEMSSGQIHASFSCDNEDDSFDYISDISEPYFEPGKCFLAIKLHRRSVSPRKSPRASHICIQVLCLEHRGQEPETSITIRTVWKKKFASFPGSMAVNSMLCAYVELSRGIVVTNFVENRSYVLKTEVPESSMFNVTFWEQDLYIVKITTIDQDGSISLYYCPNESLPYNDVPAWCPLENYGVGDPYTFKHRPQGPSEYDYCVIATFSLANKFFLTYRKVDTEILSCNLFQLQKSAGDGPAASLGPIFSEETPLTPKFGFSQWGRSIALIHGQRGDTLTLQLLRFPSQPDASVSRHTLHLPDDISLQHVEHLAVDESRGLVLLSTEYHSGGQNHGALHCVPY